MPPRCLGRQLQIQPLQEQGEPHGIQLPTGNARVWETKPPALQAFVQKNEAVSVPHENFHTVSAAAMEHEDVPTERTLGQNVVDQRDQSVDRLSIMRSSA